MEEKNINLAGIREQFKTMKAAGPQKQTQKDLVGELAGEIKDLMKMGYTLSQVLDVLNSNGMELKQSTLKNYLVGKGTGAASPCQDTPASAARPKRGRKSKADQKAEFIKEHKGQKTFFEKNENTQKPTTLESGVIAMDSDIV